MGFLARTLVLMDAKSTASRTALFAASTPGAIGFNEIEGGRTCDGAGTCGLAGADTAGVEGMLGVNATADSAINVPARIASPRHLMERLLSRMGQRIDA